MITLLAALASLGLLAGGCGPTVQSSQSSPSPNQCLRQVVPAYLSPSSPGWNTLIHAGNKVDTVIINPANGPGAHRSATFAHLADRARGAGQHLLGYVSTRHGHRDPNTVIAEINHYRSWYHIRDIFLDEAPTGTGMLPRYTRYTRYIHHRKGRAVLNPGTMTAHGYFRIADAVVVFEDTLHAYRHRPKAPSWFKHIPHDKIWTMITHAPASAVPHLLASVPGGSGIEITDDHPPNSWDTLPSYFTREVDDIHNDCRSG